MDVYPLFIEQSRTDFNKGLFDPLTNAYILEYPIKTIQFIMINCGENSEHLQYYTVNSAMPLRAQGIIG